jgi:hypothetical protein
MVPGVYDAYLAAMATAAAALVGLLFVAVSVRDDTIFGPNAMPGGEALAITAFTGLVNSLVVSLLGLIPKINIGETAVIMAVISIVAIVRLHRRLHTGRNLIVLAVTLLAYAAQLGLGVLLLVDPHDSNQLINLSIIIFVTLIVSLQRAWSLLKGKHLASAGGAAVTRDHDPPHGPGPGRQQSAASGIGGGLRMSEDLPEAPAPSGVISERPRRGGQERDT